MGQRNGSADVPGATYVLSRATSRETMAAYDLLPKAVREAISEASFAYVPQEILRRMAKGAKPEAIVRMIRNQDARMIGYCYEERAQ